MTRPKLRPLSVHAVEENGKRRYRLHDPSGVSPYALTISAAEVFVLQRFDGRKELGEIQQDIAAATGARIPLDQLEMIARTLEEALLLEGPALEAHRGKMIAEYRAADCRPHLHGGVAYPLEPEALTRWHGELAEAPVGAVPRAGRLVGAAAPHIDTRFGGASCKRVHRELAERRRDLDTLVVLGTGHSCIEHPFTLTRQRYGTPLGPVETDRELAGALESRLGPAIVADELQHVGEHSIEFQAVFLRLAARGTQPIPRVLPVLVGSFERFATEDRDPWSDPAVRGFVEGLREESQRLARSVAYLASIDLSHLGPRYGDERGLTPEEAARVEQEDRALLAFAEAGDAEGLFRHNQAEQDRRRICGISALYTLLRLLPGARGRLLEYQQTVFPGTSDTVAHCAMVLESDAEQP